MPQRLLQAIWEGSLKDSKGSTSIGSSGFEAEQFTEQAEAVKADCPVSRAQAGVEITIEAKWVSP